MENFEDIPEVNELAANEAGQIVTFALLNDLKIEIDYDVLGGVAIHLSNESNDLSNSERIIKCLWISLLNNGTRTVIDSNTAEIIDTSVNLDYIFEYLFNS